MPFNLRIPCSLLQGLHYIVIALRRAQCKLREAISFFGLLRPLRLSKDSGFLAMAARTFSKLEDILHLVAGLMITDSLFT